MANKEHIEILKKSVKEWNVWREEYPEVKPDLSGVDLRGAQLQGADLHKANLYKANLRGANLTKANLRRADFSRADLVDANLSKADLFDAYLYGADFYKADLTKADLTKAYLTEADLTKAYLTEADLTKANLSKANLSGAELIGAQLLNASIERAILVETKLKKTDLTNCRVYGASVWNVKLDKDTKQTDLVITQENEPRITVDDIEVAQFVYLMLNNQKIRNVINAITSKAVLILGNFEEERIKVLYAIKEELRTRDYLPILFDFEKPTDRDLEETVMTLAGMAKFIIADITEPRSTPFETKLIVPNFAIPFLPIIEEGEKPFAMFDGLHKKHHWAVRAISYKDLDELLANFDAIIKQSEDKLLELRKIKMDEPEASIPIRLLEQ